MKKKMKFTAGSNGATLFSGEIPSAEITLKCENCGETMELTSGIGAINSGIHYFNAKCPKCHTEQKFDDIKLWKECLQKTYKLMNL